MKPLNKILKISLIIISLLVVKTSISYSQVSADISFGVFYDVLRPHGTWFNYGKFGYCWKPKYIRDNWRPYNDGHWVWTDYGWTWVSDYEWGWAPFHYGRWTYDDWSGWIWVPGYEWAPAWVQWRYSDDYVGWSPLPPQVQLNLNIGIDFDDYGVNYKHWCFVRPHNFVNIHLNFIPFGRNYNAFHRTKNITHITYIDKRIFNHGPKTTDIERYSRSKITQYRVVDDNDQNRNRNYRIENNNIYTYRPDVRNSGSTRSGSEIRTERTINAERPTSNREQRDINQDKSTPSIQKNENSNKDNVRSYNNQRDSRGNRDVEIKKEERNTQNTDVKKIQKENQRENVLRNETRQPITRETTNRSNDSRGRESINREEKKEQRNSRDESNRESKGKNERSRR